jgi:hypothetical protein
MSSIQIDPSRERGLRSSLHRVLQSLFSFGVVVQVSETGVTVACGELRYDLSMSQRRRQWSVDSLASASTLPSSWNKVVQRGMRVLLMKSSSGVVETWACDCFVEALQDAMEILHKGVDVSESALTDVRRRVSLLASGEWRDSLWVLLVTCVLGDAVYVERCRPALKIGSLSPRAWMTRLRVYAGTLMTLKPPARTFASLNTQGMIGWRVERGGGDRGGEAGRQGGGGGSGRQGRGGGSGRQGRGGGSGRQGRGCGSGRQRGCGSGRQGEADETSKKVVASNMQWWRRTGSNVMATVCRLRIKRSDIRLHMHC